MKHQRSVMRSCLVGLLVAGVGLTGVGYAYGQDGNSSRIWNVQEYDDPWEVEDTNDDGNPDYAVMTDDSERLELAAMDYSGDGRMDNFYFYEDGVLTRHELDTNHDGRIDVRIHLEEGTHVRVVERDTTGDGEFDQSREYGDEQAGASQE